MDKDTDYRRGNKTRLRLSTCRRTRKYFPMKKKTDNPIAAESMPSTSKEVDINEIDDEDSIATDNNTSTEMPLTLYYIPDGPPSMACLMLLKHLNVDCKLVKLDYFNCDHKTEEYQKKNPQKEIPVLEDDGFFLSESNAILQYIADKYGKNNSIYPQDLKLRAIVNQRLSFNLSTYYVHVLDYTLLPLIFDYQADEFRLKKLKIAGLDVFNTYLKNQNTKYAAGDNLTIADFQLIVSTICFEVTKFDISEYAYISKWYKTFKEENPELWKIVEEGLKILLEFPKMDFSGLKHPFFPIKPAKK